MTVTSSLELMTPWRLLRSLWETPRILQTLLRNDLHEDQWMRKGIHGKQFPITLKEAVLQVIMHDIDHIEQITQLLHGERSRA